ncbi:hypothetical protein ACFQ6S_28680 [Streptomyces sp. NPDC056479]|uniref:hypothetical protein n=1 Tax=Streptomyces sp. NPDC056479 TaxID=3345832 RepID=UPI00367A60F3
MDPELADLNSQTAADEMASRTANFLTTFLLGLAVIAPLLLLVMSIMSGKFLWLTVLDLIGTYTGLLIMLRGYRDDNRALKRWGASTHAVTLLLCLVVLAILQ